MNEFSPGEHVLMGGSSLCFDAVLIFWYLIESQGLVRGLLHLVLSLEAMLLGVSSHALFCYFCSVMDFVLGSHYVTSRL